MALDKETYNAHALALEGKVFYYNELTNKEHVHKYFPDFSGGATYDIDPKITFPITSDILNNFASLLYRDSVVTIEPKSLQVRLDEFLARNNWHTLGREIMIKTLYGATMLATVRPYQSVARIDLWTGEWTFVDNADSDSETTGYMYKLKEGKRLPITAEPDKADDVRIVPITETMWGDVEHGFGFNPSVMFYAPDTQDESPYPLPYHMRYRAPNLEYNLIWSQMLLNSRVLQNVWKTNKDMQDPNKPIRLTPRFINYLGENGTLEQVHRELNNGPELELIDRLKNHIAVSAQVPNSLTGLEGIGKVESGVALNIMFAPLVHITNRLKSDFRPKCVELLMKGFAADWILQTGTLPPDFMIDMRFTENVIPVDKEKELDAIAKADALQVFTPEEKRSLILPLFGLQVTNANAAS
jgi:hypothetical protein